MLSVAKLSPGQEAYYEKSVAAGLDDYYAGRGESPGLWAGQGAGALGLDGVVQPGELGTLLQGVHPRGAERLRQHPRVRTVRVERIDPEAGTRSVIEKQLRPVAGFDLVFSCPKSVSLLHALGDEHTRRQVNEAHTSAWQAALGYLEQEACITRKGRNGVERQHAQGFVAAAFQHRTSRALDPHLHTHVIVANMARSPSDGRYRALDGEAILKTYRLATGYLYEAQLRHQLTARLGLSWQTPRKGYAELAGTSRELIDAFSRRRHDIAERLNTVDGDGFYASQRAALETRERKEPVDLAQLTEEWRARAAEHGLTDQRLTELLAQPQPPQPSADVGRLPASSSPNAG